MKVVVTGGAGFIGSNLVSFLLDSGVEDVVAIDNFSSGFRRRVDERATLVEGDLLDYKGSWVNEFVGADAVVHLAANVDNRFSWDNPHVPVRSNVEATLNVGLAARDGGVRRILYASTGTAYGDNPNPPYSESAVGPEQTSLYGATKFAAEGVLAVFSEHFDMEVQIYRFVGVLGPGYSHGHIYDFVRKITENPSRLEVLGDGYQRKAYVHVFDLCCALDAGIRVTPSNKFEVYNLGRRDFCTVRDSIGWICEVAGVHPELVFEGKPQGWVGDNPNLYLDVTKLESTGWKPKFSTEESVRDTTKWLLNNRWILGID